MLAYLVIREGSKWTDVFRLIPGPVGHHRPAPTNQIVIKDERCSRCHAEVFFSQGEWTLRDLESRNGTAVGTQWCAATTCSSRATSSASASRNWPSSTTCPRLFPTRAPLLRPAAGMNDETVTTSAVLPTTTACWRTQEPATITHRRGQTKFLEPHEQGATTQGDSQARPGRRHALPAGVRAGQGARHRCPWPMLALTGLFERNPSRRRRRAAAAARLSGRAHGNRPGNCRLANRLRACPTTASRTSWRPPCCARARRCWPAT